VDFGFEVRDVFNEVIVFVYLSVKFGSEFKVFKV